MKLRKRVQIAGLVGLLGLGVLTAQGCQVRKDYLGNQYLAPSDEMRRILNAVFFPREMDPGSQKYYKRKNY